MISSDDLKRRFHQLANEMGSRPGLAEAFFKQVETRSVTTSWKANIQGLVRVNWRWGGAAVAASLIAAALWLSATPRSLHAQLVSAFNRAKSVHVKGWTSRVHRKWPLERPQTAAPERAARFPVDEWHWSDNGGAPRSFEQHGPVKLTRIGSELRELQEDVDLLYTLEGAFTKDRIAQLSALAECLGDLDRTDIVERDLGTRHKGGKKLSGIELRRGNQVQTLWWDATTRLPAELIFASKSGDSLQVEAEVSFEYDRPVPPEVVNFVPRKAGHLRFKGSDAAQLAWRDHVNRIGERLRTEPPSEGVVMLPRDSGELFSAQWPLATSDGDYWIIPLGGNVDAPATLYNFIRLQVATGDPQRQLASWRLPKQWHNLTLNHDLVVKAGVPWEEWVQRALNHLGLEFVDVQETRKYWIAHHDGVTHKSWQDVKPPVPHLVAAGVEKKGRLRRGVGYRMSPVTLEMLFEDFNQLQARDVNADSIIIEDQTGSPRAPKFDEAIHGGFSNYWNRIVEPQYLVASDSPYFSDEEALEMARKWYREQLGITFTEMERPMTVHIVRRKAD